MKISMKKQFAALDEVQKHRPELAKIFARIKKDRVADTKKVKVRKKVKAEREAIPRKRMKYLLDVTLKQMNMIESALFSYSKSVAIDGDHEVAEDYERTAYVVADQVDNQDMDVVEDGVRIRRVWAMPNKYTFQIPQVKELLASYVTAHEKWVDPFAGFNSPAKETNDLNPKSPAKHHLQAVDFVKLFTDIDGVLFDPPYSPRQIVECYKSAGLDVDMETTQNGRLYKEVKDELASRMRLGSIAISFGWNSGGFGARRGFKMLEMISIAHGGAHNDTIVVIEQKVSEEEVKRAA